MTRRNSSYRLPRRLQLRPVALSLVCMGLAPALAQVMPSGFVPIGGVTMVTPNASTINISQTAARAIAEWHSFSIGVGGVVNITQPGVTSILLNRVTGNDPSIIEGQLNANGRVFLINTNGVMFSQGAKVNVGGLVASTLAMSNSYPSFLDSGNNSFTFERPDATDKSVQNAGRITAKSGGVVLMGASVSNIGASSDLVNGHITADGGTIGLVSGRKITLDLAGDGLTNIVIATDAMATQAKVRNSGTLQADGGRVSLIGSSTTVGELVVNQTGTVRARTLGLRNGEIVLGGGPDNRVEMTGGTLDATGTEAGQRGGSISVVAGKVQLLGAGEGQAVLDASGQAGGGSISVRGYDVALSSGSVLRADATAAGVGGSVDVGSASGHASPDGSGVSLPVRESHLQAFGEMTARGAGSGAGGTISTSGDFVRINPTRVDAGGGAQGGANGNWTVSTGANLAVSSAADIPAYDSGYPTLSASSVSAEGVGAALGRNTDVTLTSSKTGDNAGVSFDANAQVVKAEGGAATLRVNSAGSIVMNDGSAIDARAGALNVDFNADSAKVVAANATQIQSSSGSPDFDLDHAGSIDLTNATINANGGNIRFFGQDDAVNGRAIGGSGSDSEVPWRDGVSLNNSTLSTHGSGQISLRGQGRSRIDTQDSSTDFVYVGSNGVSVQGGSVQAGSGGLQIDGLAGFGTSGVAITGGAALQSTGDIALVGRGVTWSSDQPVGTVGASTAVVIDGATVASDRNVSISGTGANLDGLRTSDDFANANRSAGGGNGVSIYGSVTAGAGQRIDVQGTAGSDGFSATTDLGAIVITPSATPTYGVAVLADFDQPNPLRTSGGTIAIDGQGTDVSLRMNTIPSSIGGVPGGAMLSVASDSGKGGSISVTGRNVLVDGAQTSGGAQLVAGLDASGATGGGSIGITATNAIALGSNTRLQADTSGAAGNGGSVKVVAGDTLRAYGSLSARGGTAGGNGGSIETSGSQLDLAGMRVDASAPAGSAGQWVIDPYDVDIVHGNATGSLTGTPFAPIANTILQDGDINAALNLGTSVTIGTGTGGSTADGDIHLRDAGFLPGLTGPVDINYSASNGTVTFQLDANRSVRGDRGVVIRSTGSDALNVVFNTDVNGGGLANGGGQVSYSGNIFTNGGNVVMNGHWANPSNGNYSVHLDGDVIDTRVGQSNAGAGGSVTITGNSIGARAGFTAAAVGLEGVQISTSTGNVSITGTAEMTTGVFLGSRFVSTGAPNRQTVISTTTGDIGVVGIGNNATNSSSTAPGHGVLIDQSALRSIDGDITVRGLRQAGGLAIGDGVRLATGAQIVTSGTGNIELTGQSAGNGAGVRLGPQATLPGVFPAATVNVGVAAGGNLVLRASNDGTTDALVVDGTASAGGVLNLRPGGVDAAGNGFDQTATPITLGGTAATGFAVSAGEFTRLSAGNAIVAGSNAHAADIQVVGPLNLPSALTLQNGGGGNIQLGGAITVPKLGLISNGNITQASNAPIVAGTLMARSTTGSVLLDQAPNNVSAATVGGGAAGAFRYVDVDTVQLGSVAVTGFDAAGNAPQVVSATSMAADTVFVRTLAGDLLLGTNVSSTNGTDLVAASRLQNLGAYTITGAPWRVWADTWVGETRGGLAGSGLLPNLYHCAYFGLCTVTVPAAGNHFIYAQQPTATVTIGNASRADGLPNPPFTYSITGLILGDTGAGFSGVPGTAATVGSPPGLYAINGSFTSAEGYAVRVVPGELQISALAALPTLPTLPALPSVDLIRDMPTSWLYDRNIGPAPICLATGPLDGDRAQQGADVLAREWSRLRSRPNLTSCVDTEKRNGCSDF